MSEDHHNALVIALRCRRFAEGEFEAELTSIRANVLDFFNRAIEPHFEIEEDLLLPALLEIDESEMHDRIASEHARLRAAAAAGLPDTTSFGAFGTLLDDHVRFEERIVFEQVQERLPQEVLGEIETKSRAVPQICPTTFRPIPRSSNE